ncbi:MAG: tetratricopeptide repeat protein [Anaerolineales bacterium]|nr:tetratricopeptide repeat protein [Anaerolineales bacterium]
MPGPNEIYKEMMEKGHSAAWDQEWNRAVAFYQQALDEKPGDLKALTSVALAFYELKEFKESLKYYIKVAKLSPSDPVPFEKASMIYEKLNQNKYASDAAYRAAEVQIKNKNLKGAIELYSRSVSLLPENLHAHSRLAVIYERLGKKQQAVREYIQVASLMQHNGDVEKTVQSINRALQLLPTSEEAHQALEMVRRGTLLPLPERPHGGTGLLKPVMDEETPQLDMPKGNEEESDNPIEEAHKVALAALAEEFFKQQIAQSTPKKSERQDLMDIVKGTGPLETKEVNQEKVMIRLGSVLELEMQGEYEKASEELKQAFSEGLQSDAGTFEMGYLMDKQGRPESVTRHLQREIKSPDLILGTRLLLGLNYRKIGKISEAARNCLVALKIADSSIVSEENRIDLQQMYETIIESSIKELDENAMDQICDTVIGLLMRSNWQSYLKNVRVQLLSPSNTETPVPLADVLVNAKSSQIIDALTDIRMLAQRGLNRAAMENAFFALESAPIYLPLHMVIGELLYKEGKIQEAVEKYLIISRTYIIRGENSRAGDLLKKVINLAPMNVDSRLLLIDLYKEQGNLVEVIKKYIDLGEVYYHMAELNKARNAYASALRIVNQSELDISWKVRLLHRMADIDVQSLDWRRAIQIYEQIRKINPGDEKAVQKFVDLNFRLGQEDIAIQSLEEYVEYMNKNGRVLDASDLLKSFVEEKPEHPGLHKILGMLYHWQGRTKDGLLELDKAGELYLDNGDQAKGIQVINQIIQLNPPNIEDYRRLLAQLSR